MEYSVFLTVSLLYYLKKYLLEGDSASLIHCM